eukprot:gene8588-10422_t
MAATTGVSGGGAVGGRADLRELQTVKRSAVKRLREWFVSNSKHAPELTYAV